MPEIISKPFISSMATILCFYLPVMFNIVRMLVLVSATGIADTEMVYFTFTHVVMSSIMAGVKCKIPLPLYWRCTSRFPAVMSPSCTCGNFIIRLVQDRQPVIAPYISPWQACGPGYS